MSANGLAEAVLSLSRQLAEALKDGSATIHDARMLESQIREAQGWLITARNELDPTT